MELLSVLAAPKAESAYHSESVRACAGGHLKADARLAFQYFALKFFYA